VSAMIKEIVRISLVGVHPGVNRPSGFNFQSVAGVFPRAAPAPSAAPAQRPLSEAFAANCRASQTLQPASSRGGFTDADIPRSTPTRPHRKADKQREPVVVAGFPKGFRD
jgi:hypothetical protein